jgi:hypothetical protein
MDFRDFDDSLLYADPDYGEELYATWVATISQIGTIFLSRCLRMTTRVPGLMMRVPRMAVTPSRIPNMGSSPLLPMAVVLSQAQGPPRPQGQLSAAGAPPLYLRQKMCLQTSHAEAQLAATSQSFTLNDTFLCDGFGSLPSRPPAVAEATSGGTWRI